MSSGTMGLFANAYEWRAVGSRVVSSYAGERQVAGEEAGTTIATCFSESHAKLMASSLALADSMHDLFRQCAMVHRHWGDGSNQQEADAAISKAQSLLAELGYKINQEGAGR